MVDLITEINRFPPFRLFPVTVINRPPYRRGGNRLRWRLLAGEDATIDLFRLEQQTPRTNDRRTAAQPPPYRGHWWVPGCPEHEGRGRLQSLAVSLRMETPALFAFTREMKNGGRLKSSRHRIRETMCSCCCDNRNQKR